MAINPGILSQWVEEMRRSKGAPNSVLYALFAYSAEEVAGWRRAGGLDVAGGGAVPRIPAEDARRTRGALPGTVRRSRPAWQKVAEGTRRCAERKSGAQRGEAGGRSAGRRLEAFRELSYAKAGPFAAPGDARQYYPQAARDQIAQLEKERKELEEATPDLPRAMGVHEGDEDRRPADPPARQPLDAGRGSAAAFPARHRGREPAADSRATRAGVCNWPNG